MLHFTHVAATDGSRKEYTQLEGGEPDEVRTACGVYEGIQPEVRGDGERIEAWNKQRVGSGMWGAGLPAHWEVIDTELVAVAMY